MLKWFKEIKAQYLDTATFWDFALIGHVCMAPYHLGFTALSSILCGAGYAGYMILKRPAISQIPAHEPSQTLSISTNELCRELNLPYPKMTGYLFEDKNCYNAKTIALPDDEYGLFLGWNYQDVYHEEVNPILKHELGHVKSNDLKWLPILHDFLRLNFVSTTVLMILKSFHAPISLKDILIFAGSNLGALLLKQAGARSREYRADNFAALNPRGQIDPDAAEDLIKVLNQQLSRTKESVYAKKEDADEQAAHASSHVSKALLEPSASVTDRLIYSALPLLFDTPLPQARIDSIKARLTKR